MELLRAITDYLDEHQRAVDRARTKIGAAVAKAAAILTDQVVKGHKVIAFGNGGSAAQASHLAGELLGRFSQIRSSFAAIALPSDSSTISCIANDFGYGAVFERQLESLAKRGDVAVGLTTSGCSENVVRGLAMARKKQAFTIALVGSAGLKGKADSIISVPSDIPSFIQEIHLIVLHFWCACLDERTSLQSPQGATARQSNGVFRKTVLHEKRSARL